MNNYNWKDLLTRISKQIIESGQYLVNPPYIYGEPPPEIVANTWLGYPGATEEQIVVAENRLGIVLPPSYREFLKVSNGWQQAYPVLGKFWSTEELDWFAVRNQQWIDAWVRPGLPSPKVTDEEYFIYDADQNYLAVRVEYLQTALEISAGGDAAICLLNPRIITKDGEWEAWYFDNKLPGAMRFRSFCDLMEAQYEWLFD